MKKSRFTEEQIIGFLKQAEAGMPIKELCRNGGFSDATFYKWRAKFGDLQITGSVKIFAPSSIKTETGDALIRLSLATQSPGFCCTSWLHQIAMAGMA